MVRKSLNTHGTLLVYLLCRLLTVGCFQKNRFGEIVNSGSQNNSKVQSALNAFESGVFTRGNFISVNMFALQNVSLLHENSAEI